MGEYSDDDLDDLPESALQQLEDNAIQSTQALRLVAPAKQLIRPNPPPFDTLGLDDDDDDFDFDDSEVLVHSPAAIPQAVMAQRPAPLPDRTFTEASQSRPRWNGLPNAPASIQRPSSNASHPPSQRYQPSQPFRPPLHSRAQPSQFPRGFAPPPPRYAPSQSESHPNAATALEQRLRSLEAALNASKGEASILRANASKAQQASDAEIAALRKQAAEQSARHDRAMQSAVQAEKAAATELRFAMREAQEVASKARRRDAAPPAGSGTGSGATTPRKSARTWGVADGFDGMDLVPSPGRNMPRTKSAPGPAGERTPTRGKRKRPVESPVPPLDTTEEMVEVRDGGDVAPRAVVLPGPATLHSLPFDFLPLILDHSSAHGQPPTFDSFAQYFYPSDPKTSFSSIVFQSLPTKTDPSCPMRVLADFSVLIINLWERCLQEEFFLPIRELVSLLSFTLQLHSVSVVPELVDKLLPVAQATLHVISDIRSASPGENLGPELLHLQANLDSTAVIALLNLCAQVCATATAPLDGDVPRASFWKLFPMETVSLVLGSKQPLPDITGMLDMLATSVLPGSIGPAVPDKKPELVAGVLLDRLSRFLVQAPVSARSATQRHAVVLATLRTLLSFSAGVFGAGKMAVHPVLVLRVVSLLSRSVDELYDQDLSYTTLHSPSTPSLDEALEETSPDSDHTGLHAVISHAVLLLHGLVTSPHTAPLVDLEGKFEGSRGAGRKYLVALCRLNFAEDDGVLEVGVDVETAERAHEMLEMVVSAEGGRDVGEVFGSPE